LATLKPTSGASPTRTPGGNTASAAKAGRNMAETRTAALSHRKSIMKNLPCCSNAVLRHIGPSFGRTLLTGLPDQQQVGARDLKFQLQTALIRPLD
jgi:hypothetical protein